MKKRLTGVLQHTYHTKFQAISANLSVNRCVSALSQWSQQLCEVAYHVRQWYLCGVQGSWPIQLVVSYSLSWLTQPRTSGTNWPVSGITESRTKAGWHRKKPRSRNRIVRRLNIRNTEAKKKSRCSKLQTNTTLDMIWTHCSFLMITIIRALMMNALEKKSRKLTQAKLSHFRLKFDWLADRPRYLLSYTYTYLPRL